MRKFRSDALWFKLSPEQQKKIEHWFFVENLSYRTVHGRMRTELGVTCAVSTVGVMYHHCNKLRLQERTATLDKLTEILTDRRSDLRRIPTESLAAISGCLMQRALIMDDPKTVALLANVMMQGSLQDMQRDTQKLAEEKLAFRRMKFAISTGAVDPAEMLAQLSGTPRSDQAHLSDTVSDKTGISGLFRDKK